MLSLKEVKPVQTDITIWDMLAGRRMSPMQKMRQIGDKPGQASFVMLTSCAAAMSICANLDHVVHVNDGRDASIVYTGEVL